MNNEILSEESGVLIKAEGQPQKINRIEKSWFWITLISLINLYYTISATTYYCNMATETNYLALSTGFVFVTAAAGVFLAPFFFNRLGIFDDAHRFKAVFILLSAVGIASMISFAAVCNTIVPEIKWPAVILQYISAAVPAITSGCSLHRCVKAISVKRSSLLCGLIIIIMSLLLVMHVSFMLLFSGWRLMEISYITIYVALLIIPALLIIKNKDSFEYSAPSSEEYFPESLFKKFIVLAAVMITLDSFYNNAYYGGGNYDNFSMLFTYILMILPTITTGLITVLLSRNKWLPIMLVCTLGMCFQQGLILFFNDSEQLAHVYALADTLSGNGPCLFLLFIPLTFCVQRRKNAFAAAGILSLWFLACALAKFISENPGYSFSVLVAPAVTFTLSIATIAFLFYLYSEHNRVYYGGIIKELHERINDAEVSAAEAMSKAGFTEDEKKAAMLLLEGETQRDICRKLHMKADDVNRHVAAIREKISSIGDSDPVIAAAVERYGLTKRETEMLRCLRREMTNPQIAKELFLSEATVKVHVHNLLKKIGVETRQQIPAWEETLEVEKV